MEENKKQLRQNNIFMLLTLLAITLICRYLHGQNPAVSVFRNWVPLSGRVIVIDPGHGGIDGGANYKNVLEKNINLEVSLKLKRILEKEGANVIMTRSKDIALDHLNKKDEYRHKRDLISRVDIINKTASDIFISIHVNAEKSSSKTAGPMVLYFLNSIESRKLANSIQKRLESAYAQTDRSVSTRKPVGNVSLYLLRKTKVPGVIVELGFITNPKDREMLIKQDFQNRISTAIVSAIKEYFS
ncbi:MAG: N-acetylmuramoyl-L-alanine amidase [Tepidanaerobacteraceae bacterium]|nr:N-acetylmuramoyl-L-alanine amidase [Tepidanaerobacteraceae bacterium]